ncbi:LysM peptidoglycan-binding and 3D domain-containing protein [Bacillus solitudinis]|uniref:LysM peptidoglycan-binding and 3D domain-containing protein n=1 Tax=Bacillus solitudinis TaxID=2014074 RepID=UPI000C242377|nr:3D domain-containing protein [Bacillus solitudinis]
MKKSIISMVSVAALTGSLFLGTQAQAKEVTVQKGDTLWSIAQEHQISVNDLQEWNDLTGSLIVPHQNLRVSLIELYRVQAGDTLYSIAQELENASVSDIQEWNNIENPNLIRIDEELIIHTMGQASSSLSTQPPLESNPSVEEVPTRTEEEVAVSTKEAGAVHTSPQEVAEAGEVAMEMTMSASAYTASCHGCSGITATGLNLIDNPDSKVIAVDPNVIPLGSKVYVEGYGEAIASDTGGAIKGNKIDLFVPERQDALNWGVRDVKVTVYKK